MTTFVLATLALIAAQPGSSEPSASPGDQCVLTEADLLANSKLSFDEFDQKGVTPATARQLGERGCYAEAASATEHYLIHGPIQSARRNQVLAWHLGQYLASAGDEEAAAHVMAATRLPAEENGEFDWNSYVTGTWAFLVKDKPLLEASLAQLEAAPPERNARNAAVLRGLLRCFDKSYDAALGDACQADLQ